MEITSGMIYWLTRLDGLQVMGTVFIVSGIISIFAGTLLWIFGTIDKEPRQAKIGRIMFKSGLPVVIFMTMMLTFVPTTKQMAAIIIIPCIANNEQVQELPNKILELGNAWLEELKPNNEN